MMEALKSNIAYINRPSEQSSSQTKLTLRRLPSIFASNRNILIQDMFEG